MQSTLHTNQVAKHSTKRYQHGQTKPGQLNNVPQMQALPLKPQWRSQFSTAECRPSSSFIIKSSPNHSEQTLDPLKYATETTNINPQSLDPQEHTPKNQRSPSPPALIEANAPHLPTSECQRRTSMTSDELHSPPRQLLRGRAGAGAAASSKSGTGTVEGGSFEAMRATGRGRGEERRSSARREARAAHERRVWSRLKQSLVAEPPTANRRSSPLTLALALPNHHRSHAALHVSLPFLIPSTLLLSPH